LAFGIFNKRDRPTTVGRLCDVIAYGIFSYRVMYDGLKVTVRSLCFRSDVMQERFAGTPVSNTRS